MIAAPSTVMIKYLELEMPKSGCEIAPIFSNSSGENEEYIPQYSQRVEYFGSGALQLLQLKVL